LNIYRSARSLSFVTTLDPACAALWLGWRDVMVVVPLSRIPPLCPTGILPKKTPSQLSEPRADLFRKKLRLFPCSKARVLLQPVKS
jgi:hypothetical protein